MWLLVEYSAVLWGVSGFEIREAGRRFIYVGEAVREVKPDNLFYQLHRKSCGRCNSEVVSFQKLSTA